MLTITLRKGNKVEEKEIQEVEAVETEQTAEVAQTAETVEAAVETTEEKPVPAKKGRGQSKGKGRKKVETVENAPQSEWKERVVQISRVTKVVKGGKKLSFRAIVIVGNGKGQVGVGCAKASEVIIAMKKPHYSTYFQNNNSSPYYRPFRSRCCYVETGFSRYRCYRRRCCSCSIRACRYRKHPEQIFRFKISA